MDFEYRKPQTKKVDVPEYFRGVNPKTKIGIKIVGGTVYFLGYSSARDQYDGLGFCERTRRPSFPLNDLKHLLNVYEDQRG